MSEAFLVPGLDEGGFSSADLWNNEAAIWNTAAFTWN